MLFLLGTFYNVFILISDEGGGSGSGSITAATATDQDYINDKKRLDGLIQDLRNINVGDGSSSSSSSSSRSSVGSKNVLLQEVVPSHRIVTTSSVSSRVVSDIIM